MATSQKQKSFLIGCIERLRKERRRWTARLRWLRLPPLAEARGLRRNSDELLKENLRIQLEIEQQFIDANSWNRNVRKKGEQPIDPDPDGELAREYFHLKLIRDDLNRPFEYAMNKVLESKAKRLKKCKHKTPSAAGFCDDCGKWICSVYCPHCDWKGVDVVDSPCPQCTTALSPDQVE
jgi:hypothetical protein